MGAPLRRRRPGEQKGSLGPGPPIQNPQSAAVSADWGPAENAGTILSFTTRALVVLYCVFVASGPRPVPSAAFFLMWARGASAADRSAQDQVAEKPSTGAASSQGRAAVPRVGIPAKPRRPPVPANKGSLSSNNSSEQQVFQIQVYTVKNKANEARQTPAVPSQNEGTRKRLGSDSMGHTRNGIQNARSPRPVPILESWDFSALNPYTCCFTPAQCPERRLPPMTERISAPRVAIPLAGTLSALWLLTIALGETSARLPVAPGTFFAIQSVVVGAFLLVCGFTPIGVRIRPQFLLPIALALGLFCVGSSTLASNGASAAAVTAGYSAGVFGGLYLALALHQAARLLPRLEYRDAVATVAASLVAAAASYVALDPWHLLASPIAVLALLCLSTALAISRMAPPDTHPKSASPVPTRRQQASSLVLFVTFSLTVCCIGTSRTAPQDWGWGAALAGLVLGAVSIISPSSKLLSVSFMAAAGVLCALSILSLSAPLDLAPWGHLTMLLGFWVLETNALMLGFSSPIYVFCQGPNASVAHLGALYLAQGVGTVINHTVPTPLQNPKALASALLLMGALLASFYLLGKRTALTECAAHQQGATQLFAQLSAEHCLTARESQIMELIARGHSLKSIASTLGIAPNTVKAYRTSLYAKLGIHSRQELVDLAAMGVDALRKTPFSPTP